MEICANNVNGVFAKTIPALRDNGVLETSRNGAVIVMPSPTLIQYNMPMERVLFSPKRDANPFFHLMESLWMLAGRNDVAWPQFFNKRFAEYSDDGETVHGAYGHRWRVLFDQDQLSEIVNELRKSPDSRRAVLQMWDCDYDLAKQGKDVPCNTHAYFDLRGGVLNMTVCNRSNDAVWGAFGANVVHFSILQEYMAAWLNVRMGVYRQFTNNLHAYLQTYSLDQLQEMATEAFNTDRYGLNQAKAFPLINTRMTSWDLDLINFMNAPLEAELNDVFFSDVAQPMYRAWAARKQGTGTGREQASKIVAVDWRIACLAWIDRREKPLYA